MLRSTPLNSLALGLALGSGTTAARAAESTARYLVREAMAAQGGEAKLRSASLVEWHLEGYRDMVEQSERPEGPYIPEFDKVREVHDFSRSEYADVVDARVPPEFKFSATTIADRTTAVRSFGGNVSPGTRDMVRSAQELLSLSPERLLLTARDAADLRQAPSIVMQSVPQDVVTFTLDGAPVTLFLNHFTHLPTAMDYSGPAARQNFWRFLGDVTMRTYFSYWWLGDGGVRLPMQWDVYRNGLHDTTRMVVSVRWNAPADEKLLSISPEVRAAFLKQGSATSNTPALAPPREIAPGVTFIPGAWNVALVRQADGIVVLEAPISSAYSEQILAEAAKLYPKVPVKAVVSTSDSWPHIAGVRAYIARGIPIYCLDLNMPILKRLARAHFSQEPDALELRPREPRFVPVSGKTRIGSGPNAIDLYPLHGETGERQMIAYLPSLALLYGSDPFQEGDDGRYRTTQSVGELANAAAREGLHPQRFFLMHVAPTDWSKLSQSLAPEELKFPDGTLQ